MVTVQCWYQCNQTAITYTILNSLTKPKPPCKQLNWPGLHHITSIVTWLVWFIRIFCVTVCNIAKSAAYQLLGIRYLPFETAWQVYLPYQQTITPNCVNTKSICVFTPHTTEALWKCSLGWYITCSIKLFWWNTQMTMPCSLKSETSLFAVVTLREVLMTPGKIGFRELNREMA